MMPLSLCSISGTNANECIQNCCCTQLGRHTTCHRNKGALMGCMHADTMNNVLVVSALLNESSSKARSTWL